MVRDLAGAQALRLHTTDHIRSARLGATPSVDGGWQFLVWAPNLNKLDLHLPGKSERFLPMHQHGLGYYTTEIDEIEPNARYFYRLENGRRLPDPASRFQPKGVHGPSGIVDFRQFEWTDSAWKGRPLAGSVFYELHVGTYTPEGSFEALVSHLPVLSDLGVTTIELMPIGQFPGSRNWGYDGVYPFAPQISYGGPHGLQKFVDAAHAQGLAVALDVVYNHLGPEGNYFSEYGPYFTDKYQTPWGKALNFDGPDSDPVRGFFIENAIYWLENYHFDALRLDAIHAIFDFGASHFLAELGQAVQCLANRLGRQIHLIAESDLNDARILRSPACGGYGLHAQWSDDFHHSLHSLLTGEKSGYYNDFGEVHHLAETLRNGWYYAGQFSNFRRRSHGNSTQGLKHSNFVVCNQNHDQVGNRAGGERLSQLINFEGLKLSAGITLLSPFVPLLFMGEEYGENAPFQYFTSHGDPALIEAVRRGRREEFSAFAWQGKVPDPQDELTYVGSKLNHHLRGQEPHRTLQLVYKELLRIRRDSLVDGQICLQVTEDKNSLALVLVGSAGSKSIAVVFHFGDSPGLCCLTLPKGIWSKKLDSSDSRWLGPGSSVPAQMEVEGSFQIELQAQSFVVFELLNSASE
jgi:maltooligosyltrehalose trehalohydrolase